MLFPCCTVIDCLWISPADNREGRSSLLSLSMVTESESCSVLYDSLQPQGLYSPWNFPGQNTGVGCLSFLPGIFPTQDWTGVSCLPWCLMPNKWVDKLYSFFCCLYTGCYWHLMSLKWLTLISSQRVHMKKQKQIGEYIVHFASVFPAQEAYDFISWWVDSSSCFHIFLAYWGH